MDCDTPLCGQYSSGQFVIVEGAESSKELKSLGCFGQDLESARRKEEERRGPLDKLLLKETDQGLEPTTSVLTLHEAFYLAYALGCLKIKSTDGCFADLDTHWKTFRHYQAHSNTRLDFAIEYGVYHYFRSRGWTVKSGTNYGTDFLLYHEGPPIDHARYAVWIIHEDPNKPRFRCNWRSLLATHRVTQSVCKELLLVHIRTNDTSPTAFDKPSCIGRLSLTVDSFACKTNVLL